MVLLALSANTSFGGLPVLLKLLARDNYLPHVFALKADRQVHRHGVLALAARLGRAAGVLRRRHQHPRAALRDRRLRRLHHRPGRHGPALARASARGAGGARRLLNGFGALLTGVSAVVVTATKFDEGAWLIVVALPLLVAAFETRAPRLRADRRAAGPRPHPRAAAPRPLAGHRARLLALPADLPRP